MAAWLNEKCDDLRRKLKGRIAVPGDPSYDDSRRIWNAMIDRRPAVVVQCAEAADVAAAIAFGRENGLEISVRGGGHNIGGHAVCDNGLMLDLSPMKTVRVEPATRRAYVEPGVTLGEFDRATQSNGLAIPLGINSTTGIAGLTLGGGFGWLTRQYGLTIDNLISADVTTADGTTLHASETSNPDLFWAIRGGGGNFGVVTQFEYQLYPVGPEILAGLIVYPFHQAMEVLSQYREFVRSAPEELVVWVVLRKAPPLPFLPQEVHGKEVVVLPVFYNGEIAKGDSLINPLRHFGDVLGEHVGPQPYTQWQQAFDPLLTPGARNYWKSHNFTELSDGAFHTMIDYASKLPTPQCEIFVGLIAGAANRVPSDATAYSSRDAKFVLNVHGRWDNAAEDEECIGWSRAFFQAAAPYASPGAYVNFMTAEEGGRVATAYGANYARLLEIKRRYDPENIFHLNQNIRREEEQAAGEKLIA